ncbi:MAG: GNAT family N-acetyltransferase [Bacteroidota bacterium]|nr:GNAT family N-acetyltransferase [Bacteroidota bacterium]
MEYSIIHVPEEHRFFVELEGMTCFLTYLQKDNVLNFTHTWVPKPLEGRGIAASLVHEGLEYARLNSLKVIATCPYVGAYLKRHPEYQDLVY